jgi:hypothetical protein
LLHRFKNDFSAVHHCRNLRSVLGLKVAHPPVVALLAYTLDALFGIAFRIGPFSNADTDSLSWVKIL